MRLIRNLVILILVAGTFALVRQLLVDRAPKKGADGDGPVFGSLDTWPEVPRAPGTATTTPS
jgi:hypothetical protein